MLFSAITGRVVQGLGYSWQYFLSYNKHVITGVPQLLLDLLKIKLSHNLKGKWAKVKSNSRI